MAKLSGASSEAPKRGKEVVLRGLGVRIRDGQVFKDGALTRSRLGPLAGARAEITDPTRHHRIGAATVTLMPIVALSKKSKAMAFVVFPDGSVYERRLDGNSAVRLAQRDVVKFNALANARSPG